jgi:hypothetical protein
MTDRRTQAGFEIKYLDQVMGSVGPDVNGFRSGSSGE